MSPTAITLTDRLQLLNFYAKKIRERKGKTCITLAIPQCKALAIILCKSIKFDLENHAQMVNGFAFI